MTSLPLKYVERFRDRHGKVRHYFRRRLGKRTPLPGLPGSDEFMAAYNAALNAPLLIGAGRYAPGTFAALADQYFNSTAFMRLKPISQAASRAVIERFLAEHGHRLVEQMTPEKADRVIAARARKPDGSPNYSGANNLLKRLRILINFGIAHEWIDRDPTKGIKKFKEGEYHTWTEEELAAYEAYWPLGSRERTAFALHLYTGQRRTDVCRMTWADIVGDCVRVVQSKTGIRLTIKLHPELQRTLAHWPRKHVALLHNERGKPYTVESYGNLMSLSIGKAGLPDRCVLHGLRKAAARRLAEAGCSEKEISAVTGHTTLTEVARYTRGANQEGLASAAILRLGNKFGTTLK